MGVSLSTHPQPADSETELEKFNVPAIEKTPQEAEMLRAICPGSSHQARDVHSGFNPAVWLI
jgi:hypothetical protein